MAQAAPRRDLRRTADQPGSFLWFHELQGWPWWKSLLAAFFLVIAFRGLVDLVFKRDPVAEPVRRR